MKTQKFETRVPDTAAVALLLVCVLIAVVRLVKLLTYSQYGIDFTDEGYYLVWIANPAEFVESVTQFGFVYHPLYELLGGDIALLRQCNILITFGLAWVLGAVFFRSALGADWPSGYWRSWPMLALTGVLAISYPNLLNVWLPTPSYNSLALQAMLLTGIGLLLVEKQWSGPSALGLVFVGVGGWLAFMAKPTSAAAIAVMALVYLQVTGKFNPRQLILALGTSTLLVAGSAWIIDGSVGAFVTRLSGGLKLVEVMGAEQSIARMFRLDGFSLTFHDTMYLVLLTGILLISTLRLTSPDVRHRLVGMLLLFVVVLVSLVMVLDIFSPQYSKGKYRGMVILAAPWAAVAAGVVLRRTQWEGSFSRRHLALAVCFAVVPHVFAFGSGNNYWQTGLSASIFWILAGLAIFVAAAPPSASWSIFLPVAAGAQMVAVLMLHVAVAHPYRQPQALGTVDEVVTLGAKGAQLRLSHDYAAYVTGFRLLASGAGFTVKTPVIDLTGHSPGTLFSLGGRSIGQPWLLGGYPGSDNFAVRVLRNVPCDDLAAAWLLVEPKGPRKLTPTVLKKFAINVEQDFESVGVVSTPPGFGDYAASSVQQLLKPTRDIRSAAGECERMKASAR